MKDILLYSDGRVRVKRSISDEGIISYIICKDDDVLWISTEELKTLSVVLVKEIASI